MTTFNPGDKVIKRNETDPKNYGKVMDLPAIQMKPGYVAVYFKRHVWIKPENLMHFDEWKQRRRHSQAKDRQKQADAPKLSSYWSQPPTVQGKLRGAVGE